LIQAVIEKSMSERENSEEIDRWVQVWERADRALMQVRRRELMSYDYGRNLPVIDEMLRWACENAIPRTTTGLVEQQRWFRKLLDFRQNPKKHDIPKEGP